MRKIKIYLSETFFTLEQQLLNYLNDIGNTDIFSVFISAEESRLDKTLLTAHQGFVLPHAYEEKHYQQLIVKLGDIIDAHRFENVEVHFPVTTSAIAILAFGLLRQLSKRLPAGALSLHVWDGKIEDVLYRQEFSSLRQSTAASTTARLADELKLMMDNPEIPFRFRFDTPFLFYFWHTIFETTYHFVRPELMRRNHHRPFFERLLARSVAIEAECIKSQDKKTLMMLMKITGIDGGIFAVLKTYMAPGTLMLNYSEANYHKRAADYAGLKQYEAGFVTHFTQVCVQDPRLGEYTQKIVHCAASASSYRQTFISASDDKNLRYEAQCSLFLLHALGCLPQRLAGFPDLYLLAFPAARVAHYLLHEAPEFASSQRFLALLQAVGCNTEPLYARETSTLMRKTLCEEAQETLLIKMESSLGDCMFALAAVKQLHLQRQVPITFMTRRAYVPLAQCCPWVDKVIALEDKADHALMDYCAQETRRNQKFCEQLHIVSHQHQIDACLKSVGLTAEPGSLSMTLDLSQQDVSRVTQFFAEHQLGEENIVLLHGNIGDPNRTWSGENWNALAEQFIAAGWRVIAIGSTNNKYAETQVCTFENGQVINAVDRFSIIETIALMRRCQLLVATDSGPVALAGASDIGIVALYTIVPGERRIAYRHGELGWNALCINLKCRYGHCMSLSMDAQFCRKVLHSNIQMRRLNDWCPLGDVDGEQARYACITRYPAERLFKEITTFIGSPAFIRQDG